MKIYQLIRKNNNLIFLKSIFTIFIFSFLIIENLNSQNNDWENKLSINKNFNHSKIKTILINVENRDSLIIRPRPEELRLLLQDWIPPRKELVRKLNFQWADSKMMNISEWEDNFLEHGYSIADRNQINSVLKEQALSLAGFNDKIKSGSISTADAIVIINKLSISSNMEFPIGYEKWEIKMISIQTSEIIMSASFFSMFGKNSSTDEMIEHDQSFNKWKNSVIKKYINQSRD